MWRTGSLSLVCCLASAATAQQANRPDREPPPSNPQRSSDVTMPRIDQPLRLSDFNGMQPRPDLQHKLGHVSGFVQRNPNDGAPATEPTEVWFARTSTALYFVFVCYDKDVRAIRGHLSRREDINNDDHIIVLLDPFQDRRKGVVFSVNPYGVQADANYTDNNTDYSYDQVWDSDGRITSEGWLGLLAIPFRSIRSHPLSSDWGVVFYRDLPRNSEESFWPRVSENISGILQQEGTLHGVETSTSSHNIQLNPYGIAQNERTLFSLDPQNPYFSTASRSHRRRRSQDRLPRLHRAGRHREPGFLRRRKRPAAVHRRPALSRSTSRNCAPSSWKMPAISPHPSSSSIRVTSSTPTTACV